MFRESGNEEPEWIHRNGADTLVPRLRESREHQICNIFRDKNCEMSQCRTLSYRIQKCACNMHVASKHMYMYMHVTISKYMYMYMHASIHDRCLLNALCILVFSNMHVGKCGYVICM